MRSLLRCNQGKAEPRAIMGKSIHINILYYQNEAYTQMLISKTEKQMRPFRHTSKHRTVLNPDQKKRLSQTFETASFEEISSC
jgi:hypothetical protein